MVNNACSAAAGITITGVNIGKKEDEVTDKKKHR
jgi:hypothetical protein